MRKKHNYERMKNVNIAMIITICVYLLVIWVNSSSIEEMFGFSVLANFNYGTLTYFIGQNHLIIIPLAIIIRNVIIMNKIKNSNTPSTQENDGNTKDFEQEQENNNNTQDFEQEKIDIIPENNLIKNDNDIVVTNNEKNIIDNYDNLKKLKELLDNNIITNEEFNEEKERILKEKQ